MAYTPGFTSGADSVTGTNFADTGTNTTAGNDTINGNDIANGSFNQADLISYLGLSGAITVNFTSFGSGTVAKSPGGTDHLISVERVEGTAFADSFTGSGGNDSFIGGAGNDTYNAGAHSTVAGSAVGGPGDVLSYWAWGQVNAANSIKYSGGIVTKSNGGGTDTVNSIELLQGTAHADSFTAGTGNDSFYGSLGNDVYNGGAGSDFIGYSIPNGMGSGPTVLRVDMTVGIVDKWSSGVNITATPTGGSDAITSIEAVFGTSGNDLFIGGDPTHSVFGFSNTAESFGGGFGNDTIIGTTDGSFGGSVFVFASYGYAQHGIMVDLSTNMANIDPGDVDTFDHITGVNGSNFNDTLIGGGHYESPWGTQFDSLLPQAGNDLVIGSGFTVDRVQWSNSTANMTVDLTGFDDSMVNAGFADDAFAPGEQDTLQGSIEQIFTGAGNDTVTGSSRDESFVLSFGNNQLDAGAGEDTIQYSSFISVHGIVVDLRVGTVTHDDSLGALSQTDSVVNVEAAVGTHYNDQFFAAGVGETQKFEGLQGNDTLTGDSADGAFTFASYQRSEDAVVVDLNAGTADDGFGGTDSLIDIQGVQGSMWDDSITGSDANEGFIGLAGFDTIDGGIGKDTVSYERDVQGDSDDPGVVVNLTSGTALDNWGFEDTLLNIEAVLGSHFDDALIGSAAANTLEGHDGNDLLQGLSGADTLKGGDGDDTLGGGIGVDSMVGGLGEDVYNVDAATDKVVETTLLGAGGHDVVGLRIASGTYTLAANVEDLYMIGAASINAIGTAAGNYMRGNNGANVLKGMAGGDNLDGGKGDDVLHGGNGKDMLHGGGGADAFVFGVTDTSIAATNADLINDFKSTIDHIDFDNALFTQIGSTNFGASDARFYAAAGAKAGHDTNDRIIYDTASGKLYYDADGSNAGAVVLVATLQGHPTVAATDIHVI